uniref:Metallothionein-like protein n=1 Tax=Ipomoea batatas TaxID=4120 RepID=Q9AUC4_IPOBA|nr:metallothionein-like protein [Ipomoea batatas]
MSDKCGNCDCADSTQCTRKGSKMDDVIFVTEKSYTESIVKDIAAENDGCKCGANCSCTDRTCGH